AQFHIVAISRILYRRGSVCISVLQDETNPRQAASLDEVGTSLGIAGGPLLAPRIGTGVGGSCPDWVGRPGGTGPSQKVAGPGESRGRSEARARGVEPLT